MHASELSPADLCRRLADGWTADDADVPREVFNRLRRRWHATSDCEQAGTSVFRTKMGLCEVRLLGAADLGCLILGRGAEVAVEVKDFWQTRGGGGRGVLVFATTPTLKEEAQKHVPKARCVFLDILELEKLLTVENPLELLKDHFRNQIPLGRLLPYDILHPAAPNMFFGRREILDRFHHEEKTSFAVAGPGRIGKSSLLRHYQFELRQNKWDERCRRLFFLDCLPYDKLDSCELSRRIALDISADSEAGRVNERTLLRFLRRHSCDGHQPLELLLDEVDSVCSSDAMEAISEAVRHGYCRVILCGKGGLYAMMRRRTSQFARRLELIRPLPLDSDSASRLLLEPMGALGIRPENDSALRQKVFTLTARRPNLIQECAKLLFQFTQSDATNLITERHLERLSAHFVELSHALLPLEDLRNDLTRLMTLLWLREGGEPVTVGSFQRVAKRHGLEISAAEALDICDDLWICNVLIWERNALTLASPHLVEFVRMMNFNLEIERLNTLTIQHLTRAAFAS
jgi:hypothetical protein